MNNPTPSFRKPARRGLAPLIRFGTLRHLDGSFGFVKADEGHGGWIPQSEIERLLPASVHLSSILAAE